MECLFKFIWEEESSSNLNQEGMELIHWPRKDQWAPKTIQELIPPGYNVQTVFLHHRRRWPVDQLRSQTSIARFFSK